MEQARQPAKDKDPLELHPQGRLLQVSAIFRIFLTVIDPFKQDGSSDGGPKNKHQTG
jgi:hypothetical protein